MKLKERVKQGKITVSTALSMLLAKADLEGGEIDVAVAQGSDTYKWLRRRM